MAESPIKTVVFDCDGVILESVEVKTMAFGQTVADHGEEAGQRLIDYHLAHGGVSRFEKFRWFYREVLGRELSGEEEQRLNILFTDLCLQAVLSAEFVPGIRECIEKWYRRIPLHVASGTPHEELVRIFQERKLDGYFQTIRGTPPPKADLLQEIVEESGVRPEEVLMVGDSSTDLEAAEAVGTKFYGRGEFFAHTGHPWSTDMTGLDGYLDSRSG